MPGFGGSARLSASSPRERLVAGKRDELVDVHARRDDVDALDMADDLLEHFADVLRADEDGLGRRATSAPPRELRVPRIEYSSSEPCALTAYRRRCRRNGPAEHDVVREHEVGRQMRAESSAFASRSARARRGQVLQRRTSIPS